MVEVYGHQGKPVVGPPVSGGVLSHRLGWTCKPRTQRVTQVDFIGWEA